MHFVKVPISAAPHGSFFDPHLCGSRLPPPYLLSSSFVHGACMLSYQVTVSLNEVRSMRDASMLAPRMLSARHGKLPSSLIMVSPMHNNRIDHVEIVPNVAFGMQWRPLATRGDGRRNRPQNDGRPAPVSRNDAGLDCHIMYNPSS